MSLKKFLKDIMHIVSENKLASLLLFVAVVLRFYKLEEFATFIGDQGRDAIIIKRIVSLEHFPLIGASSSVGGMFLGPFYYYLVAPFLLIFNYDPLGLAVAVALLSTIGLSVSYLIIKKTVSKNVALLFLILVVFSIVNIENSRFSWNPNLLPIFSFLTLFFFYKALTKQTVIYSIMFGSLLSLSLQLHYLVIFLFPAILIIWIKEFIKQFSRLKIVQNTVVAAMSFFAFYSPLILFDLRHDFLNTRSFIKLFTTKSNIAGTSSLSQLLETNQYFFSHVFKIDINQYLAISFTVLLSVYILMKLRNSKNLFLQINTAAFLGYIYFFSFLNSFRYPHYYNSIYYVFYFLLSTALLSWVSRNYIKKLMVFLIVGIYVVLNVKNYYYFNHQGSNQIKRAQVVAKSLINVNPAKSYQIVSLPPAENDSHVRYFLELWNKKPFPEDSPEQPEELYILCHLKECDALNDGQWQIASFKNKKVAKMWNILDIKVYKIVHGK